MSYLNILSAAEQVADFLRTELLSGTWRGMMPGSDRLAVELGVGGNTVEAALRLLEKEGLLANQGRRRGRVIVAPGSGQEGRKLRVAILVGEDSDRRLEYMVKLEHGLLEAGHKAFHLTQTLLGDFGMDVDRVAKMVAKTPADAWILVGASQEVLAWFCEQSTPAIAIFGRRRGLPMAGVGPDKPPACAAATRILIGLGHRRIVLLARRMRRLPEPGAPERAFLGELAAQGIPPGPYHLPDWEESIDGFHERLESLFRVTPPTALIIDEAPFFVAALQFLAGRGLRVPEDVSLICTDADATFAWCQTSVAHIRWDSRPVVRRVLRWAANISRGQEDLRQTLTPAEFVQGGTIGPVAKS